MEEQERSASAMRKHGELTDPEMGQKARVPGMLEKNEFHQRRLTHGDRERRLQCRYQYQEMCSSEDETRGADAIQRRRAASQGQSV